MRRIVIYGMIITLLLFSFFACRKKDIADSYEQTGTITGKVVAANGVTAIRQARVFISANDKVYTTLTANDGSFSLRAPAGLHQLHIQTGNGHMFRTVLDVTIQNGQTTTLPGNPVKLNQVANLAYVTGFYDKIEQLLIDSLGYTATFVSPYVLQNINDISGYDAIFINCGSVPGATLADASLADYVANGGSLYVSDWAVRYLVGESVPASSPCSYTRAGGFLPDSLLCVHPNGRLESIPDAPILSPVLQAYLNKNTMLVNFDLDYWEKVYAYNPNFWEVMVFDPIAQKPLLIRTHSFTNNSRGTVNIGSPNNNNWVTICHKPAGSNPITLTIPQAALPAHLAHGDSIGECGNEDGSGRIYYTTFHNAHNGQTGPDVKNILQFMILNL